jgi:phosphopantothenoylcysteine decarboxylase/phosphopantothenate--cysteine ligase
MNDRMWANAQTTRNVEHLRGLGYTVVEPHEGPLAAGEGQGPGRMPEPEAILAHVSRLLEHSRSLAGRKIVITAGATREPIDPVRFISNHSSGRMGVALAEAAWRRGAEVTLIAAHIEVPVGVQLTRVFAGTTRSMRNAVGQALEQGADALIMAAAPADFRPAEEASKKIKKSASASARTLDLVETEDILASTMGQRKKGCIIVGFALETDNLIENAQTKLEQKALDMIVANSAVEEGAGFGVSTNRVTLLSRGHGREEIPIMPKTQLADVILDRVEKMLNGR